MPSRRVLIRRTLQQNPDLAADPAGAALRPLAFVGADDAAAPVPLDGEDECARVLEGRAWGRASLWLYGANVEPTGAALPAFFDLCAGVGGASRETLVERVSVNLRGGPVLLFAGPVPDASMLSVWAAMEDKHTRTLVTLVLTATYADGGGGSWESIHGPGVTVVTTIFAAANIRP